MSECDEQKQEPELDFEVRLDEPPQKVWRAISIPALRDNWLPAGDLIDETPVASTPEEEVSYRMRDDRPPFLESIVTLRIRPDANNGTILRIIHRLDKFGPASLLSRAANNNSTALMQAA